MNREALKELGLTDEQIEAVMKSHGKAVNELKEQVNDIESLKAQNEDLTKQLTARDEQLEELKKVDAEGLQAKIDELQQANEQTKTEYEEQLHKQAFDFKLTESLRNAKVRNTKAVKALLDLEQVKLDGDTLLNLDNQLEQLKESDAYLFEQDEPVEREKPTFTTGTHSKGVDITPKDFKSMSYTERLELKRNNPSEYEKLTNKGE